MPTDKLRTLMKWLRVDWLAPISASNRMLREQYDVTVRVYACIGRGDGDVRARIQAIEEIDRDKRTWSELYEMEMLLTRVEDDAQARRELARRVAEARKRFGEDYVKQYETVNAAGAPAADVRAALLRLVNDLLWTDTKEETCRRLFACVTARACFWFIVCTGLFLWMVRALLRLCDGGGGSESFTTYAMYGAAAAGAWGATFSMLLATKQQPQFADLERLKVVVGFWQTIARPLVGAGCGIILYLAIVGGFLNGTAFPSRDALSQPVVCPKTDRPKEETDVQRKAREEAERSAKQERDNTLQNLALLALWCFVAGFSEQIVMGVLDRAGNTSTGATAATPKPPGS